MLSNHMKSDQNGLFQTFFEKHHMFLRKWLDNVIMYD